MLVERYPTLGGVCLNVGCIPSKALLHAAKVITDAEEMAHFGVTFGEPKIDLDGVRKFKEGVVGKLTKGLAALAKATQGDRGHRQGAVRLARTRSRSRRRRARRSSRSTTASSPRARSRRSIPGFPYDDPRLMDSTGALELQDVPKRLLIIGGGIIGLEMATVYDALGSKVTRGRVHRPPHPVGATPTS